MMVSKVSNEPRFTKRFEKIAALSALGLSLTGCVLEPYPPEGPPPPVAAAPGYYAAPPVQAAPAYYATPCCYSYYNYPGPYYYGGPSVGLGFYGGRGGRWR